MCVPKVSQSREGKFIEVDYNKTWRKYCGPLKTKKIVVRLWCGRHLHTILLDTLEIIVVVFVLVVEFDTLQNGLIII